MNSVSQESNDRSTISASHSDDEELKEEENLDEAKLKKFLFKYARIGNLEKFEKCLSKISPRTVSRGKFKLSLIIYLVLIKQDEEKKSILHHILMNANH